MKINFCEELKKLRKEKNLSVPKLAELSGLPKTTIYNYEKGSEPTINKADKLLKALGVTMVIGKEAHDGADT